MRGNYAADVPNMGEDMMVGSNGNNESSGAAAHAVWEAIERSERVAWHDEGADRYLYRPAELLVASDYEMRLAHELRKAGARRARLCGSEGRQLQKLGLRRWILDRRGRAAPDVVDGLRQGLRDVSPEELARAVTVNHVLGGAQIFRFGPGDLPVDDGPDPVVREESRRLGTGKGVRVAILDTGFLPSSILDHPLLARDYEDDGDDRDDLYDQASEDILSVFGGHGTFIAGIIRQQAPEAVLDPEVTLDNVGLVDDVELALDLLRTRPAGIVNLSLAGPTKDQAPPPALAAALAELGKRSDAVFVAAAGNDYELAVRSGQPLAKMWPAAFATEPGYERHVVAVAAVDRDRRPTAFSNRGPWITACAFGYRERSTYVRGTMVAPAGPSFQNPTATWSGTSFAAPRVAGVIAATMTSCDPPMSPRDALQKVLDDADLGPTDFGKFVE